MYSIPIQRRYQTTDQTSPWDGVVFTHEVGSDELAEALKTSYSQYRTLRERKHAAIIDFLTLELSEMPSSLVCQPPSRTSPTHDMAHASCEQGETRAERQRYAQSQMPVSAALSPLESGHSSAPQELKQGPADTPIPTTQSSFIDPTTAHHSSQFVFNAIDGRTMQQKTKRKMTAEERLEYKETRKRGACPRCKRQKGKCTHMNGLDSDVNSPSKIVDQFKMSVSLDPALCESKPNKSPRLENTVRDQGRDAGTIQQYDVAQQQSSHVSRRSSNASMQSLSAHNSSRWLDTVGGGTQLDTPGYVHQSCSFEPNQSSVMDDDASNCWPGYNRYDPELIATVESFRTETSDDCSQNQMLIPGYPSIRVHEPEQYQPFDHWNYGQPFYPDSTGCT